MLGRKSLRFKVLVSFGVFLLTLTLVQYFVASKMFMRGFSDIEQKDALTNLQRVHGILDDEIQQMARTASDWAEWDDPYNFLKGTNPDFPKINIDSVNTFERLHVNMLAYVDAQGTVRFAQGYDLVRHVPQDLPLSDIPFPPNGSDPATKVSGLMMTRQGPAFVAITPVLTTKSEGPPAGLLIMARYVNAAKIGLLSETAKMPLHAHSFDSPSVRDKVRVVLDALPPREAMHISVLDENALEGSILLRDVAARPVLVVQAKLGRNITQHGRTVLKYLEWSSLGISSIFFLFSFFLFERQILSPLSRLSRGIALVEQDNDAHKTVPIFRGDDEVSRLASAINRMLAKLEAARTDLKQARDDAVRAAQAKAQFLANMSHEIRTPLNGVLATAELLETTVLDTKQTKYLRVIRHSGELLRQLLNDILDLSKIEANKVEIRPEPFHVRNLVESAADLFSAQATAKGLRFSLSFAPDVPARIVADPHRLHQVMANLISNAVKYTEHGHVEVHIALANVAGGPRFVFRVSDSGLGMPAEVHSLIFEKFTQVHRTSSINGTGLGLPICKSLIEMMGGEIGVESEVGKGSSFWFQIPLVVAEATEEKNASKTGGSAGDHRNCKILLVEDIETNRYIIGEILKRLGCHVETAENGQQALIKTENTVYDLVLMDCSMPVMDGYEATRHLRQRGGTAMPVIALTAHSFAEDVQKCLDAGMNDFVSKPVKIDDLRRMLDKWHVAV